MASIADVQAALAANETKETTIIGLLQTEAQLQKDTLAQHRRQDDRRQHRHGRGDRQHYATAAATISGAASVTGATDTTTGAAA